MSFRRKLVVETKAKSRMDFIVDGHDFTRFVAGVTWPVNIRPRPTSKVRVNGKMYDEIYNVRENGDRHLH